VITHELTCDDQAGSSSIGVKVVQHAKRALIPAVASLCLAATFQVQAQDAARATQPVPGSPAEESAEVVLPMTVITPTPGGAQGAQGDTRFQPKADTAGNCGRVVFKKVSRVGMINNYSVTVISTVGPMETIFYTAWPLVAGDTASGAVAAYGAAQTFFNFTLRNPFNTMVLMNGFAHLVSGIDCIILPSTA